jgi:protein subunit release factor B
VIHFGVTERKKEEIKQRMQKCGLLERDIVETFVRSRGSGGQKVNKTSSCVYLKPLSTGLAVKVQTRGDMF